MKGLVWHGKHDLRLEDVQEPRCGEGEALLEVKYAGICGSDLTIYQGKHKRAKPPTILGHEFSGVVVAANRFVMAIRDRLRASREAADDFVCIVGCKPAAILIALSPRLNPEVRRKCAAAGACSAHA